MKKHHVPVVAQASSSVFIQLENTPASLVLLYVAHKKVAPVISVSQEVEIHYFRVYSYAALRCAFNIPVNKKKIIQLLSLQRHILQGNPLGRYFN